MLAKAAMVNAGRNLINHWGRFQVEMAIPWRSRMWESYDVAWSQVGTMMDTVFHRTDFGGTEVSGWLWTPVSMLDVMDGFSVIGEDEALHWIGETGGQMPHVDHPHGTLVTFPKELRMEVGTTERVDHETYLGTPPYVLTLGPGRPAWATLDSATNQVVLSPSAGTTARKGTVPLVVTDANGEEATAALTVRLSQPGD